MSAFLLVPQEYACLIETVLAARATMVVWLGPVRSEGGESALVLPEIPDQSPDQVGGEVTMGCGRCSNPPPMVTVFYFMCFTAMFNVKLKYCSHLKLVISLHAHILNPSTNLTGRWASHPILGRSEAKPLF